MKKTRQENVTELIVVLVLIVVGVCVLYAAFIQKRSTLSATQRTAVATVSHRV